MGDLAVGGLDAVRQLGVALLGDGAPPPVDRSALLRMSEYAITNRFRTVPQHAVDTRPRRETLHHAPA